MTEQRGARAAAAFFDLDKTIIAKSSTPRVQPAVLPGRADQPARRAAQRVRAVRLPRRRRRPRPDGADAGLPVRAGHRLGRRAGQARSSPRRSHELIDPIIYDEAVDADRGAPAGRPRRRHRQLVRRRGGRADRRDARRRPGDRHPAWSSTTAATPARSSSTPTARPRPRRSASWPRSEGYDLARVVRLQRLGHRPADARGRRPPGRRQPGCALRAVAARPRLAGARLLPAGRDERRCGSGFSGLLPHEPRRAAVGVAAGAVALGVAWYAARRRSA